MGICILYNNYATHICLRGDNFAHAGSMLLVLLMTMATASLSASFAVFLVRERANKSKHVQTVSGAPPTAFWASVYLWDLINYAISAAGQSRLPPSPPLPPCAPSLPLSLPLMPSNAVSHVRVCVCVCGKV